MAKGKYTFVVSDESINANGFVILTSGIDTSRFERNPIMLYMHERKNVVGRWENISKDGDKLLADAVFDTSTELGQQVKNQVDGGFLRSASIGADIVKEEDINGIRTVTESVLFEISIVDVPCNSNALRLYKTSTRKLLYLAVQVNDLRGAIIALLGLENDVSDDDILAEIQSLLSAPDEALAKVDMDINEGIIDAESRMLFYMMAKKTPDTYKHFVLHEKMSREKQIENALKQAVLEQKLTIDQKGLFREIGLKMGGSVLSSLLQMTPKPRRIVDLLMSDKEGWTLEDYRRNAPQELKENPDLYNKLLARERRV